MIKVEVACPCGTTMHLSARAAERKKYCSKACFYQFRKRPSGLTYNIKVVNRGWLRPGHTRTPTGPGNPRWKGDQVGYTELHRWVRKQLTRTYRCEWCHKAVKSTDWANLSHEYKRDLSDWVELCRPCHGKHDSGSAWGSAIRKYGREGVRNGH